VERFAFVIHPIDPKRDVARKFKALSYMPVSWIDFFSRYFPPIYISHIPRIRSATGREAEGWLLACPYTPRRMLTLDVEEAYHKIVQTARLGQRLGARIVGLGAFTSVVGDAGISVSQHVDIPVTTGNSYAVTTVIHTMARAAQRLGLALSDATVAVVGATGSIGRACAQYAAKLGGHVLAVGRRADRLRELFHLFAKQGLPEPKITTDMGDIRHADLVIAAAGSDRPVIEPEHLGTGAIVCDVALPPNVSPRVFRTRQDVLVVDGGIVFMPGKVNLGFDLGLPSGMTYACMAETMILALEGRYESFTLGREISLTQLETIDRLAAKHGFRVGDLRTRGRLVTTEELHRVKEHMSKAPRAYQGDIPSN